MRYFLAALATGPTSWPKLPILGIAAAAFLGLAIFSSPLWLTGVLLPLGFAFTLAANPRFRNVVDSRRYQSTPVASGEAEYAEITSQIKLETLSHLRILERKGQKIIAAQRESGTDEFTLDANDDALRQLLLIYAKILLTRQQLLTEDFSASIQKTQTEIASAENNLQHEADTEAERASLSATLSLLQSRLQSLQERKQKLEELDSDLRRVEAHFDLSLSQANMRDRPQGIASDIGLASSGLSGGVMADSPVTTNQSTPAAAENRVQN